MSSQNLRQRLWIPVACLALCVGFVATAQTPVPQTQPVSAQPSVKLNVIFTDSSNRSVSDVRQDELSLFEDDVPQTITSFAREETPVSYGFVVDVSGSLNTQLGLVVELAKAIVKGNKAVDETFIVTFAGRDYINIQQDFTTDKTTLDNALDGLSIQEGQTAIVDALYLSVNHLLKNSARDGSPRRHALILITDGDDRDSYYKKDELFKILRRENVQVFGVGLVNKLPNEQGFRRASRRESAAALLKAIAKETGGRALFLNNEKDLPDTAADVSRDLRTTYVLGYSPATNPKSKDYRKVKIMVADATGRDKRIAITRPGYTAPNSATQNPKAKN